MRRNRLAVATLWIMLLLTAAFFIACGGSGVSLPGNEPAPAAMPDSQDNQIPELPPTGEQLEENAGSRVVLEVPSLTGLSAGDEFTARISIDAEQEIHQGVLRLLFEAGAIDTIQVMPGERMPADMVRIATLGQPGVLPLAFTALPDARNISPGSGTLLEVRFRLNTTGEQAGRIRFAGEREFLQLRDRDGQHVDFSVETSAGADNEL